MGDYFRPEAPGGKEERSFWATHVPMLSLCFHARFARKILKVAHAFHVYTNPPESPPEENSKGYLCTHSLVVMPGHTPTRTHGHTDTRAYAHTHTHIQRKTHVYA